MDAAAGFVQKWALYVNPENSGNPCRDGFLNGGDRSGDHVQVVADEGRQKSRCPELPASATDFLDSFHRRAVVGQRAGATIDLRVDEAGQQEVSAKVDLLRAPGRMPTLRHRSDVRTAGHHGQAFLHACIRQDSSIDKRDGHYSVSVTLDRCCGWSGLKPRATDSAFTMR